MKRDLIKICKSLSEIFSIQWVF